MHFFTPVAWVGLLSIPAILIMYLLKQKYKDVPVPSLFLWKQALNMSKAQRPWQKLRRNLLMFLQLALAFFIVSAMAGPYVMRQAAAENTVFVLDASMSMMAEDETPNRFEKAKATLSDMVSGLAPGAKMSLVVADDAPYIAVNGTTDKLVLLDKLKQLKPGYTTADHKTAASLAAMLSGQETASVYLFSDGAVPYDGLPKRDVILGQNADNAAVTLVSHVSEADRVIVLCKVKNYGAKAAANSVAVYYDDVFHDMKEISLAPGGEKDIFFTDLPPDAKNIVCRLTANDVLAADDTGYDVAAAPETRRVMLVTGQNVFLENILSLLPGVELYKTTKDNMESLSGFYLYVFDGLLPEAVPKDGHLLVFNPPEGSAVFGVGEQIDVTTVEAGPSGLTSLIGGINFDVAKSKTLTLPGWADVALFSPETPLVYWGQNGAQKTVVMGFDLHDTDLPLKKEFPIFMYNLIQYFMPTGVAAEGRVTAGEPVRLNTLPDAKRVTLATPDNLTVTLAPPFPVPPYDRPETPGFYTLAQELPDGTVYGSFAVNVTAEESDLTRHAQAGETAEQAAVTTNANKSLAPYAILLILAVLLAEWGVFVRAR